MNILFIGPPGSGKGTQSKLLHDLYGLTHLSTGDMFRAAITQKTAVGMKAKEYMDRGEYVPDAVVIDLIRDRLCQPDIQKGFILDGFPRTVPQAEALDLLLEGLGMKLTAIFFFEVDQQTLVQRLSSRQTCRNCGRIITAEDLDGALAKQPCIKQPGALCDFHQRNDDKAEVVQNRIQVYQTQTTPVVNYYRQKGNFVPVEASLPPEQVFKLIDEKIHGSRSE